MAITPRIFISATSGDLKSHRATVAAALRKLETYAEVQDHWPPDYRTVEQMLRRRIKDCDAVIHLAGLRYGAEPGILPPGVLRRSYTQMEYHLARELKKPVYLFLLPDDFPWDDGAPPEDEEKCALQQAHRAQILADAHLRYSPADAAALQAEVLSLQPLVEKLRASLRRQRLYITTGIAALLTISAGIAWAVLREKDINIAQERAITELQRPESAEVKFFKEIQLLRNERPVVSIARAGGDSARAELMSYSDSLATVAKDHGLTADALRGMLDAFATRVLDDPKADKYERALAEFHRQNFAAATTLATSAAEAAEKVIQEQRQKAIESWTLAGDSEKEQVRYKEALAAYQKALKAGDKKENPKQWADLAMNAALMYQYRAAWAEAEALYGEILAVRDQAFGPDSMSAAHARNHFAALLFATDRLDAAADMLRRARLSSAVSSATDRSLDFDMANNLAVILLKKNSLQEAEQLFKELLVRGEETHGKSDPAVATILNSLAGLYKKTGRAKEAEDHYRRAWTIDKDHYGPNHPQVAIRRFNLGRLLADTGRVEEAEPHLREALKTDETAYGPDHPKVASRLEALAGLLVDTKRPEEAVKLMRRALSINKAAFPKGHSAVVDAIGNLGGMLIKLKEYEEAEPLLREALALVENAEKQDVMNLGAACHNLATLLYKTKRPADAAPLMKRTLECLVTYRLQTGAGTRRLEQATEVYRGILTELGDTEEQAQEKIDKITAPLKKP